MGFKNWLSKNYPTKIDDEDKKIAEKKSKIYVLTIQILFGIIIGISFTDYHKTLVPFQFNFETLMILVAYATVLVSLVGYSITISNRFHINFIRFFLDVFLLYLYYQLVYSPLYSFRYLLEIIPAIFFVYVIWQILEYFEWRKIGEYAKNKFLLTVFGTIGFLDCFLIILWLYNGKATVIDDEVLKYSSVGSTEIACLFIILGLLFAFRVFIEWIESKKWEANSINNKPD